MARDLAPDGGPRSHIHMNSPSTPTITVIRLEDDAECVINVSDFDPLLHEKVEAEKRRKQTTVVPPAPDKSGFGKQTPEELAAMTTDALKALPEWAAVPNSVKDSAVKKAQIVEAILAVRSK